MEGIQERVMNIRGSVSQKKLYANNKKVLLVTSLLLHYVQ